MTVAKNLLVKMTYTDCVLVISNNTFFFQDDELIKDELIDDRACDEPTVNEQSLKNRRKIRKTD